MSKIRVLIADDHTLVRAALRALLSSQRDLEVVAEAADAVAAVENARRVVPDVVLMDLSMPGRHGGIGAIGELRRVCPGARAVAVTMHEDEVYARQAMLAGATGYVLKSSPAAELLCAIRKAYAGETYVTPALRRAVAKPANDAPCAPNGEGPRQLTPREHEVAGLIALGLTNAQVALRLHISEKTVETHRMHVKSKLGLRSRADVVRFAIEYNLVKLQ